MHRSQNEIEFPLEPCPPKESQTSKTIRSSRSDIRVAPGSPGKRIRGESKGSHTAVRLVGWYTRTHSELRGGRNPESNLAPYFPKRAQTRDQDTDLQRSSLPPEGNIQSFGFAPKISETAYKLGGQLYPRVTGGGNTVIDPTTCAQPHPRSADQKLDCRAMAFTSGDARRVGWGAKTRGVECKQVMAQNHTVDRIPTMCPSQKPSGIKPCNTKSCVVERQAPSVPIAPSSNMTLKKENLL
ncbi:hypothetical protein JTB14_027243 [Gonioctena quinquepunctata]|nr:hypothetical protein JTB14_027243 [Gonioctena quinquepunctata]